MTQLSSDHCDTQALTPSHFLIGKTLTEQFTVEIDNIKTSSKDISLAYGIREGCIKHFWDIWLSEYLRNLPPVNQKTKKSKSVIVGTLVLVRRNNISRVHWPIGRITKVYPGRDGVVRSVDLMLTDGKTLKRSIDNLHHLETFEVDNLCDDSEISDHK